MGAVFCNSNFQKLEPPLHLYKVTCTPGGSNLDPFSRGWMTNPGFEFGFASHHFRRPEHGSGIEIQTLRKYTNGPWQTLDMTISTTVTFGVHNFPQFKLQLL